VGPVASSLPLTSPQTSLDDPLAWGILPTKCYFSSRTTRWTLGASEIMFTNPWDRYTNTSPRKAFWSVSSVEDSVFSTFFRLGQSIETFRGQGIYQEAVDLAIEKINQGGWVCPGPAAFAARELILHFRSTSLVRER